MRGALSSVWGDCRQCFALVSGGRSRIRLKGTLAYGRSTIKARSRYGIQIAQIRRAVCDAVKVAEREFPQKIGDDGARLGGIDQLAESAEQFRR